MNPDEIKFYKKLKSTLEADTVKPEELIKVSDAIVKLLQNQGEVLKESIGKASKTNDEKIKQLISEFSAKIDSVTELVNSLKQESDETLESRITDLQNELDKVTLLIPEEISFTEVYEKIEQVRSEIPALSKKAEEDGLPENIKSKLEALEGENRIDRKAIKGLDKVVEQSTLDRAVSILDSRTSFLINKVNNLTASGGGGTWGSITGTLSDQTDLQAALDEKIGGLGALNEVAYFSASRTLTSSSAFTFDGTTLAVTGDISVSNDILIASGGIINFNAGDVTITHAANTLTFAGASSGFVFSNRIDAQAQIVNTGGADNGRVYINDHLQVANNSWFNASIWPTTSDTAALGSSTLMWSDLFLASGGVINWNAGNATLTHSASLLTSNVDIVVPAETYGSGWNGSNEVPTKNDVYDKIEALSLGGGTGITWSEVTGTTQSMAVNCGYIANNASLVTLTLPTTAAVGDVVRVVGKGAGGWRVAQNASEIIHFGNLDSTTGTGGYIEFTHLRDAVELVCVVADTEWNLISSVGNLTVV